MERLVEMGGAEGRTVCVRDQFQVIGKETSFLKAMFCKYSHPRRSRGFEKEALQISSSFLALLRIRMLLGHPDPRIIKQK